MKIIMLLMSLIYFTRACEMQNEATNSRTEPVPVTAVVIDDTLSAGQEVSFTATASTPNPCWKFDHFDFSRNGKEIKVTVHAEYDGRPCLQTVGSFDANGSTLLTEPGTYTLKFWQGEEKVLEKKVVVQ